MSRLCLCMHCQKSWTESHDIVPANQQQGMYSSQSEDRRRRRGDEGGVVSVFALAMRLHEVEDGAYKGVLKGGV